MGSGRAEVYQSFPDERIEKRRTGGSVWEELFDLETGKSSEDESRFAENRNRRLRTGFPRVVRDIAWTDAAFLNSGSYSNLCVIYSTPFASSAPFCPHSHLSSSYSNISSEMPAMVSSMTQQPMQQAFNPYTENGGTILAVAGADFSVIAGDTRQSEGYSIQTRYAPKVFKL